MTVVLAQLFSAMGGVHVPYLINKIVLRVALFTRSHPLARVLEKYGQRMDELIDKQNRVNKTISLTYHLGDDYVLNNVHKYYGRHHRKFPVDMTRCRIGMFIADSVTGNSLTAPSAFPGNKHYFSDGIKIRMPDRQVRFKYHYDCKPSRADCGHQSVRFHQVRSIRIISPVMGIPASLPECAPSAAEPLRCCLAGVHNLQRSHL